jgi:beta-glucosidase
LESTLDLPCLLDEESTIREWLADPRGKVVFEPLMRELAVKSRKAFSGSDSDEVALGVDIMDMFMDMPVASVLMFQQSEWTEPADEIVAGLLAQVHQVK